MSQNFEKFYGLQPKVSIEDPIRDTQYETNIITMNQSSSLSNAESRFFTESIGSESNAYSEVEAAILKSTVPIDLNESEEITINGERGIWANKSEIINWRGILPISQYQINDDPNPEIIRKRTDQQIVYQQEVAIRYLRPPTPPAPGEILIQQEENSVMAPAPPLVIRQQPPRPTTPPPLVIREAPPPPPPAIGRKVITISGKRLPPPPRKVIIERLPPLPSKPQSIIIERWLPYRHIKRKVIYIKANDKDLVVPKPKNIVVQWEQPKVVVKKEFKDLGIVRANPSEYIQRYGTSLKRSMELPSFVKEIRPPAGVILAAEQSSSSIYELEGDVYALNLVDLEREGLIEYRYLIKQLSGNEITNSQNTQQQQISGSSNSNKQNESVFYKDSNLILTNNLSSNVDFVTELFRLVNLDSNNSISISDAEKVLYRLNTRLGKKYGESEANAFFQQIDLNRDGRIDFNNFKRVLEKQL